MWWAMSEETVCEARGKTLNAFESQLKLIFHKLGIISSPDRWLVMIAKNLTFNGKEFREYLK